MGEEEVTPLLSAADGIFLSSSPFPTKPQNYFTATGATVSCRFVRSRANSRREEREGEENTSALMNECGSEPACSVLE